MPHLQMFRAYAADARSLAPDEVLFAQGDLGDVMFAVVEGELELRRDGTVLETVGPGDIVGEMALIDQAPRSASAIAQAPARVVEIDKKQFMFLLHEHPTFALQVMRTMADRLRRMNDTRELDRR